MPRSRCAPRPSPRRCGPTGRRWRPGDGAGADALAAWLGGQPHVAAAAKRSAGIRGELDHFGAMGFLQGLLEVLRDAGHPGLLLVLDEVETLQRVRGDVRDKALNALRQLLDEIDAGRYPGLFLVITGTPAFYDGPSGVPRLPPLAQRLATDFSTDPRFDNPRAVQVRLPGFDRDALLRLGAKVRDLYAAGADEPDRVVKTVDDGYVGELADAVTGSLGGKVGVAPRVFLKKLVTDVLDRVDQFGDFDPRRHYALTLARGRAVRGGTQRRWPRRPRPAPTTSTSTCRDRAGLALDRLHPVVVHHIVNTLGWPSLRALQEEAAGPVLDGADALLLAPTAGGKTEAAVFPLLTAMDTQRWSGLSVIYVCPLKALLNNLLPRLRDLCRLAGPPGRDLARRRRRVGAAAAAARPAGRAADHAGVAGSHADQPQGRARALFAGLRAIVVDEVHAFAGDDRGWHLLAVLERLTRVTGRPIQRIGLSATVGNPDELLGWLQGSGRGQRPGCRGRSWHRVPRLARPRRPPPGDVELDYVGSVSNAATVIASLHRGEKRLVFCDSRQLVEEIGAALRERGVTTFLSHASLPLDERRRAEQAFAEARDCVIVATSTLELGVDVGDLDRVIQVNDPPTRGRVPAADRADRPAAGQPPELPVPRPEPGRPAVVRRAAAPVGPGIRRAGGGAAGAAAHRRPAAAGPVPAGAPDRQPPVGRGVERAGAVRPQRRADPAVPGGAGVHRPGRRAAVRRARGRAAVRAPALHGDDRRVHRPAAVHRAGRAAGGRADRPHAAHREDRRPAAAPARRAQLEGDLDRLEAPPLLRRARRGRRQGPLAHPWRIGGQLRAVARGAGRSCSGRTRRWP